MKNKTKKINKKGQSIIEILIAFSLLAIVTPAIIGGLATSRQGKAQQIQRLQAIALVNETQEAVRSVREKGWPAFAVNGTYHPVIDVATNTWKLDPGDETLGNGFSRMIVISDVMRDANGAIVESGGTYTDASTKRIVVTISWTKPTTSNIAITSYVARYTNASFTHTTKADFDAGVLVNTQTTNTAGGEIILANNNRAKWCSPELSSATIDLPDGPPVAVSASSHSTDASIPNKVYVATSPNTSNSIKMAHLDVPANNDPPVPSLRGIFTLDPNQYSNPSYVPSGIGIDNTFKTTDIKYYTAPSGKIYALMTTDLPNKEVIAIQIFDGTGDAYQDPVNHIYKYWTFFNTTIYGPSNTNTGFIGPFANGSETGGDNDGYGTNPSRAYTNNNSFAVDTNSGNGVSTNCTGVDKDRHRYNNYGFNIPAGSTINGIELRLDAKADSITGSPKLCVELSWDGGITWTSNQSTSTLTTTETSYMLGGVSDTWGRTWSDTDFSNANFRVRITNVASDITRDFSLDWAAVKVYYNAPAASTNDQAPFGYGGASINVLGDSGYVISGGYLYVFDLSTIDNKTPSVGLDMLGCRIQLDGYSCLPGSGTDRKYTSGETGTTWSDTTLPVHNDCSDGGNIELNADNDIYPVAVGGSTYLYAAVGAGTNPEFDITNATSIPTYTSNPAINNNSCGRVTGGNASWKRIGSLDFNTLSGTEEAANSVYATADGNRAYISSNGGIDANGDGNPDSYQMYILNTSNKSSPQFLSGSSSPPTSGYYYTDMPNRQLYPRRSLTVLNGQRAILVGKDGVADGNDAQEYQVANIDNEASPTYCGGINYDVGFNDLTSVSEADGDNYVYMVANTAVNELKIIQGGPDSGIYVDSGTFESSIFNSDAPSSAFNSFTATVAKPASTDIKLQVASANQISGSCDGVTYKYLGPNGSPTDYFLVGASPTKITGQIPITTDAPYVNPGQCFRYKAFLSTIDTSTTPTFLDMLTNYSP